MNLPKPASHPTICRSCHGTGWEPGPPVAGHHHGKSFDYQMQQPCTHLWSYDNPNVDEYGLDNTTPITFNEYYTRLLARHARGQRGADLELAGWDRNIFNLP